YARPKFGAASGGVLSTGATLDVSALLVEQSPALPPYFDGSSTIPGRTAAWIGTPNNSASTLTGDTVTVDRASGAEGDYFDGNTPDDDPFFYGWEDEPYASASQIKSWYDN